MRNNSRTPKLVSKGTRRCRESNLRVAGGLPDVIGNRVGSINFGFSESLFTAGAEEYRIRRGEPDSDGSECRILVIQAGSCEWGDECEHSWRSHIAVVLVGTSQRSTVKIRIGIVPQWDR